MVRLLLGACALAGPLGLLPVAPRASVLLLMPLAFARLDRDELLSHPTRAALLREVRDSGGLHLRELHRRVGGAWGAFAFHVRTLVQAGHLRERRQGRYVVVVAAGARPAPCAPVCQPLARRILDALPHDGAPVALVDLRDRLGVSRQLLDYHLRRLEGLSLVAQGRREDGARTARRATATAALAPSTASGA